MEEPVPANATIKHELIVKTEQPTDSQENAGEHEQVSITELSKANIENVGLQTVVLQNIDLSGQTNNQLELIGKIISQQNNSDGNLEINTLEENNVMYIINNGEYEEIDSENIVYEEIPEDGENSIEYVIEEGVEYEEECEENIQYTQVVEVDEGEYYEYATEEAEFATEEAEYATEEAEYATEEAINEESVEALSVSEEPVVEPMIEERLEEETADDPEYIVEREWTDDPEEMVREELSTDRKDEDPDKIITDIKEEHLECDLCSKVFRTTAGLKRHITVNHEKKDDGDGDDPLTLQLCPCCGEPSDSAHTIGDFQCEHCDKRFVQINFLQRHLSIEHPKSEQFDCVECLKRFDSKKALIEHMKVHPVKNVKCLDCNRVFTRKYHLDRHIGQTGCMGQPRKVFDCRVCKRGFTRKDNLAEHLRNHAGQAKKKKNYECEFCQKVFQGYTLLNIHVRTHTGERPYQCDLCPKRFPSSGAMKKHRRMHTGEKPYRCEQCSRTFAAKETLNRHYRIHTGEKPHQCKFCGKAFIQPSQLRAHIFHHTGENAYTCQYCGRAFNRKLRLTNHIKFMHEGAEPLPCSICQKKFFRKEDVARHMLSHSGEKPYVCEECPKAFAVKSSLKIHMNIHRTEPPCSCETCGRAFIRKDCLMRHIRARHRDVLEDILSNAEKKRLQQQLLTAATECANENLTENIIWNELTLTESIKELLTLLVDEDCLLAFGYPDAPVDKVLDCVIKRCGHEPASEDDFDYIGRIRENAKLLFTVVIDDEAVKELLNNQTVDEVILHVLRLAKKQNSDSS